MRPALLLLLCFCGGCSCGDLGVSSWHFACHAASDCAAGETCNAGACVTPGQPSDGGAADASVSTVDSGPTDAGSAMDGGSPDAGVADAGSKDAGAAQDGGSQSDGGATDAGAPYFVSIATASNLLANSMTINVPAGAQSGDLLLAVLTFGETTNMTAPVITVPTGWTQVRRIDQGTTSTLAVYYHPVQPGEPSSYTWTTDLQAKGVEWIACYRQASGSPPVDVETAVAQGAGTTFVTPALTTTAPNTLIVASFGGLSQTQPSTWMLPSGVASQANFNDGELRSGLDLESPMPAPGPVPTFSVTTSQVQASVLIDVLALQP